MSDWPFLLEFGRTHHRERMALATLVACEGSSYRPPGARMLVLWDGRYRGSLSGGCLEEGIASVAMRVIAEGRSETIEIDTRPHFGCPGVLRIFIEVLEPGASSLMEVLERAFRERRELKLATRYDGHSEKAGTTVASHERPESGLLVEEVKPVPRLLAVGWTRDMEPVLQIAGLLGWERHRLVRDGRMVEGLLPVAGERVEVCAPEEMVSGFRPDPMTAVLIMTHHLATDLAYLKGVFPHRYGYVGLLGSKRRRETLLLELGGLGLLEDESHVLRFHAPVGLDLGGSHPSVIGLSIVAEIQAVLTGHQGGFLRDRAGAVHSARVVTA